MFDFEILKRQIIFQYPKCKEFTVYSIGEVIAFCELFLDYHERYCRFSHPRMSNDSVAWVICNVSADDENDYSISDYMEMIPKYFETHFEDCDYSMIHFLSGDIRKMRFYECVI